MTFRRRLFGAVLDFFSCRTARMKKRAIKRRQKQEKKQKQAQRCQAEPRQLPKTAYGRRPAWPQARLSQRLQKDEETASVGLLSQDKVRQNWENTGKIPGAQHAALPSKPASVRQANRGTRRGPELEPATTGMNPATVREVINIIGRVLEHVPYAICGQAAMVYYGNEYYEPPHVSILVPDASRDVVRCWAVAQGLNSVPGQPNCFTVVTRDGLFRSVRVKIIKDSSFDSVITFKATTSKARLMTLPGLANQIARAYVADLKSQTSQRRQQGFARDMRWVLRRIAAVRADEHWLSPETAKEVLKAEFWLPFTSSFPETVLMFAHAGLDVDEDGCLMDDGCYGGQVSPRRGGELTGSLWAF
ncbi:hypothetical protein NLU13_1410 [Sarocladium strictum]|uniref:Uncharacterized protein n=1 Tax=Sarocladium strictum TaxID=5046 RepID=A0AA39GQX2_SARSR|nr:hypothetical protein NLU13_1410 [Sarocladium strictum]